MSKLNIFAVFGILFLSSVLLGSGMYSSSQIFALKNQTGTENEAEINAEIEQENKCKKDTECENENELNNQLDITTTTGQQQEEPGTLIVNKEIFGCDNINENGFISMSCRELSSDSEDWLSCADPSISNSPICQNIEENFFDIEVLDGQNTQIQQFTGSVQGTTIEGIESGTYAINEIVYPAPQSPPVPDDQLLESPSVSQACIDRGFSDGGSLYTENPFFGYSICIEYEDEQGNDCSQTTVNTGENKVCTVKNYILFATND